MLNSVSQIWFDPHIFWGVISTPPGLQSYLVKNHASDEERYVKDVDHHDSDAAVQAERPEAGQYLYK